jgi:hypothetical protein
MKWRLDERASTGPKDNEAGRQAVALCPLTRQQTKEQTTTPPPQPRSVIRRANRGRPYGTRFAIPPLGGGVGAVATWPSLPADIFMATQQNAAETTTSRPR